MSVPCRAQARATLDVGSVSARDIPERDIFAKFGLVPFAAGAIEVPLVDGCVAWVACQVILEPHHQARYDLYLGEMVAALADERVFRDGRWHFAGFEELRTIQYVAGANSLRQEMLWKSQNRKLRIRDRDLCAPLAVSYLLPSNAKACAARCCTEEIRRCAVRTASSLALSAVPQRLKRAAHPATCALAKFCRVGSTPINLAYAPRSSPSLIASNSRTMW